MTRRTHTGMAAAAAMTLALASGSALAGGAVEIQRNDGPMADDTKNVMYDPTASHDNVRIQSTEMDQRGGSNGSGTSADTPTVILTMDPVTPDRGWLCQVMEQTIGDFVSIGLVCN